ncbi:unnamed protein product [Rangifer tarandus platyrhynchus]|uniref:Uncharacterized protein n=1 Tax=Rangifer tarandus platyrhynchus TaxID=3082113 RepID=A0ABN8XJI3_RANTA|nr:unnamed protein product [Rangifer tarandus platyrhynchus]
MAVAPADFLPTETPSRVAGAQPSQLLKLDVLRKGAQLFSRGGLACRRDEIEDRTEQVYGKGFLRLLAQRMRQPTLAFRVLSAKELHSQDVAEYCKNVCCALRFSLKGTPGTTDYSARVFPADTQKERVRDGRSYCADDQPQENCPSPVEDLNSSQLQSHISSAVLALAPRYAFESAFATQRRRPEEPALWSDERAATEKHRLRLLYQPCSHYILLRLEMTIACLLSRARAILQAHAAPVQPLTPFAPAFHASGNAEQGRVTPVLDAPLHRLPLCGYSVLRLPHAKTPNLLLCARYLMLRRANRITACTTSRASPQCGQRKPSPGGRHDTSELADAHSVRHGTLPHTQTTTRRKTSHPPGLDAVKVAPAADKEADKQKLGQINEKASRRVLRRLFVFLRRYPGPRRAVGVLNDNGVEHLPRSTAGNTFTNITSDTPRQDPVRSTIGALQGPWISPRGFVLSRTVFLHALCSVTTASYGESRLGGPHG